MKLFSQLEAHHTELYREYHDEVFNLMLCNGPSYLWNSTCDITGTPKLLLREKALENELILAQNHSRNLESSYFYRLYKKILNIKKLIRRI